MGANLISIFVSETGETSAGPKEGSGGMSVCLGGYEANDNTHPRIVFSATADVGSLR